MSTTMHPTPLASADASSMLAARAQALAAASACGLDVARGHVLRVSSRICLAIEHGDYNGTDLVGVGVDRFLWIAFAANDSGRVRAFSAAFPRQGVIAFDTANDVATSSDGRGGWAAFAIGAARVLQEHGLATSRGVDLVVHSDIPGGGMSRSAALSIGLLLALCADPKMAAADRMRLAKMAQQVENEHVGSPCGILDPLMIAFARAGNATVLRRGASHVEHVAWGGDPRGFCALALDTGRSRHGLQGATYPLRRRECEEILGIVGPQLGCALLAEAADDARFARAAAILERSRPGLLPRLRYLRDAQARFPRILDAFARGDAAELGACVRMDGISLRDDYCISGPELEAMCDIVRAQPGCHGERMLGGGDCGASGAIVDPARADAIADAVRREYPLRCPAYAGSFAVHRCATADGIAWSGPR